MTTSISSLLTMLALPAGWVECFICSNFTLCLCILGCWEHIEKALRDLLAGIWAITWWRGWGMLFALSQVWSFLSWWLLWAPCLSLWNLTPSFVYNYSSAPGDWVNCGLCGEWAHFGCDRRQGLGTFKVKNLVFDATSLVIITPLMSGLLCRIMRRQMGWNTSAHTVV